MTLLLKNLTIHQGGKNFRGDILIKDGIIASLNGGNAKKEVDFKGCIATVGWFDLDANFNDPGNEHKEDIASGSKCAAAGGFTDVCLSPDTYPPILSKNDVNYLLNQAYQEVELHVKAKLVTTQDKNELAEFMDLAEAGAVAFSNGDETIFNVELLVKILQYTGQIHRPVFQHAYSPNLRAYSSMHEGKFSTILGLRGEPSISEIMAIETSLSALRYAGGHLHFSTLSTAKGVSLIREAKKEGLALTCDTSIHQLLFTDQSIENYDTNFKVMPPYRLDRDRLALLAGLKDGTIDAICSHHRPQDQESKQLEFDLAAFGSSTLQTFYPAYKQIEEELEFSLFVEKITNSPRKILGLMIPKVAEGQFAKLTIVDPKRKWVLDDSTNFSKSRNSPFWGKKMTGKVVATVNGQALSQW